MAKLVDAQRSLQKAKQAALERLQQIEEERDEIKSTVKSLDAALRALQGNKPKTKRKPKSNPDEFSKIVDETLHALGTSTFAELQAAILLRLRKSDVATHDLAARLQLELSESRFERDGDHIRFQAGG